jgi:hypothetical protein
MQLATVALNVNGYQTFASPLDTRRSKPGHHQIAIQAMRLSVGLALSDVTVLDALRKQRYLFDNSGDTVPGSATTECLASALAL